MPIKPSHPRPGGKHRPPEIPATPVRVPRPTRVNPIHVAAPNLFLVGLTAEK